MSQNYSANSGIRPARFKIELVVQGTPAVVWERLWDLDRHTAAVPLTVVTGGPLAEGVRFVGRTGVGPLQFDDPMVVREWDPPRRCVIKKVGGLLLGQIEAVLEPVGTDRTLLTWKQDYSVGRIPGAVTDLSAPVLRAGYAAALRKITSP